METQNNKREILDSDGENLAVRSFLMQYGVASLTVGAMLAHMNRSGWRDAAPAFALAVRPETHLTKAGAQIWIRHLISMEPGAALAAPVGADVAADLAELAEWRRLKDPSVLHASLLRGLPASLPDYVFQHIAGAPAEAAKVPAISTEYVPAYKTITDHNGKVTGCQWVNAADAPNYGAATASPGATQAAPVQPAPKTADDAARLVKFIDWYLRGGLRMEIDPHGHVRVTTAAHIINWLDGGSNEIPADGEPA